MNEQTKIRQWMKLFSEERLELLVLIENLKFGELKIKIHEKQPVQVREIIKIHRLQKSKRNK